MIEIISHVLVARALLATAMSRLSWKRLAVLGRRNWRAFWTVSTGVQSSACCPGAVTCAGRGGAP